jgi:uncharacterized protein
MSPQTSATRRLLVGTAAALAIAAVCAEGTGRAAQSSPGVRVEQVDGAVRYTNRLIDEKSPYLQLHAHNPVDWYPWGEAAFERARREGKPIFLSIGYSTCHWCHVMEAESFSDPAIADLMNRNFVSIKVDREERPDVDRVYMSYLLASTGEGAWPISVFLTPDLKPFEADTYVAPDREGRPGFGKLLQIVIRDWTQNREKVMAAASAGTQLIASQAGASAGSASAVNARALDQIYGDLKAKYDEANGGFGRAPKFPRPAVLNFLLRHYARTSTKTSLDMALRTLHAMANGGIHDQLGGGFHRYATDRGWHVPHFEKMLYDQAQLAVSYTEAYQITRDPVFAGVAHDVLDYVLREMHGAEGGFFSAQDADSRVEAGKAGQAEGAFYVWTAAAIRDVLGNDTADLFDYHYGVTAEGNVPPAQDQRGELTGKNVLSVRHTVTETAAKFKRSESEVRAALAATRRRLFEARAGRPRPPLDDKVIVAWNGMMVSAFARASQVFDAPRYLDAARASAELMLTRMYDANTNLLKRRYRQGQADIDGMLEDYVFLVQGLTDLYEASFDIKWLSWAIRLQEQQDRLFRDARAGGYFSTRAEAENILVRMKDDYDGAEPSPNSVAAMNLLRLSQMTDRKEWRDEAEATFAALAARLTQSGAPVPQLAVALDFSLSKPKQIVVAGAPGAPDTRALLRLVHDRFIPNKILLLADGGAGQKEIARWLPVVADMSRRDGRATIYICENYLCRLPTADLATAGRLLDATPRASASK